MSSKLSQRASCQMNATGEDRASRSVGGYWADDQAGISPTLTTTSSVSSNVPIHHSGASSTASPRSDCEADSVPSHLDCSSGVLRTEVQLLEFPSNDVVQSKSAPNSSDSSPGTLRIEVQLSETSSYDVVQPESAPNSSDSSSGTPRIEVQKSETSSNDEVQPESAPNSPDSSSGTFRTEILLSETSSNTESQSKSVGDQAESVDPPALNDVDGGSLDHLQSLEHRLVLAQREIQLKDREVDKLNQIRLDIESETVELTASLFQEANKMVLAANEKRAAAEKSLHEASMRIDMLQAEVTALKALVITSTPSRPNTRKYPHLEPAAKSNGMTIFKRGHRRTVSGIDIPRHRNFLDASPPHSPPRYPPPGTDSVDGDAYSTPLLAEPYEMAELCEWRQAPSLDRSHPFIDRLYRYDIDPCLHCVSRAELRQRLIGAINDNAVFIEALPATGDNCGGSQTITRGESERQSGDAAPLCSLLDGTLACSHRIRLPGDERWLPISQLCRNRVIAVCECVNYLRYIQQGLVKAPTTDVFRRIAELRRNMTLARLGFPV